LSFALLTGTALTVESLRELRQETPTFLPEDEPVNLHSS